MEQENTELNKKELIAEYDKKIGDTTEQMENALKRVLRMSVEQSEPGAPQTDMIDLVLNIMDVVNRLLRLNPKEEFKADIAGPNHILSIEAQPISAFGEKPGMTYEEFKEQYPNFVAWIESNGWTYSEDNDNSLKNEQEK